MKKLVLIRLGKVHIDQKVIEALAPHMTGRGNYGEVAKSSLLHCNVTGTSVESHLDITMKDV